MTDDELRAYMLKLNDCLEAMTTLRRDNLWSWHTGQSKGDVGADDLMVALDLAHAELDRRASARVLHNDEF